MDGTLGTLGTMDGAHRVCFAGYCGIVGGIVYFLQGIAGTLLFPQFYEPGTTGFVIGGLIATTSMGLLLIGVLGILWGGGLGGAAGKGLLALAILGFALMVVGGLLTVAGIGPLTDPETAVSLIYLLGRLIAAIFTLATGIAVIVARRWQGWARFAPLLFGLWPILGELLPVIIFGEPVGVMNDAWGLCGALLGLAVLVQARSAGIGGRLVAAHSS
jgi:hypothetical protein